MLHLRTLSTYKDTIKKLRSPRGSSRHLNPDFQLDRKAAHKMHTIQRSKLVNRTFKVNEEMTNIFKNNLNLQKKLDEIKYKGTGIAQSPHRSLAYCMNPNSRFIGPNERQIVAAKNQSPSLNLPYQKKEAKRIDYENLRMAKRLVGQHAELLKAKVELHRQKQRWGRSASRTPSTIDIGKRMESHRSRIMNSPGFKEKPTPQLNLAAVAEPSLSSLVSTTYQPRDGQQFIIQPAGSIPEIPSPSFVGDLRKKQSGPAVGRKRTPISARSKEEQKELTSSVQNIQPVSNYQHSLIMQNLHRSKVPSYNSITEASPSNMRQGSNAAKLSDSFLQGVKLPTRATLHSAKRSTSSKRRSSSRSQTKKKQKLKNGQNAKMQVNPRKLKNVRQISTKRQHIPKNTFHQSNLPSESLLEPAPQHSPRGMVSSQFELKDMLNQQSEFTLPPDDRQSNEEGTTPQRLENSPQLA